MIKVGEFQFMAIVVMGLLALFLMSVRGKKSPAFNVYSRARRILVFAPLLGLMQFLLQYVFRLRESNLELAVMVNLLMFMPISTITHISLLYVQRNGKVRLWEYAFGVLGFTLIVVVLLTGCIADGWQLGEYGGYMCVCEAVAAVIYSIVELTYDYRSFVEFKRVRKMLDNYYDNPMGSLIRWTYRSVLILTSTAMLVPAVIFFNNSVLLAVSAIVVIGAYTYFVFSFVTYGYDIDVVHTAVASADDAVGEDQRRRASDGEYERVHMALEDWCRDKGFVQQELTIVKVARELGVPRHLLSAYINDVKHQEFRSWLSALRVEEAKRMLLENKNITNESIAEMCGFSNRTYFQRIFRSQTGLTPSQWVAEHN